MEEDEIIINPYKSFVSDPNVESDLDRSGIRTTTQTDEQLLANVPDAVGLRFDPTNFDYTKDLYNYYGGGLPMVDTATDTNAVAPVINAPITNVADTSSGTDSQIIGSQDQAASGLGTDTSMYGGDLDQGGAGDGITNYEYTPEETTEQQQAIDQSIQDLKDSGLYNLDYTPEDPTIANARLNSSFYVPNETNIPPEQPGMLDNISTAARDAFETVKSGASTALDFIKDYGYPAYQALQGNLVAAGTALASPLTLGLGFAGKVFESLGDTKSQEEYNLYSDEQKASIDAAYGPGGVMDGYNAVSGFGQGVQATVQSRLDQRRSSGIPDTSAASQELIGLQNNLGITDFTQLTQEQIYDRDDVDPADVGREINFETGEITGSPTGDVNIYDEFAPAEGTITQSNAADYLNELLDKNSAIDIQKKEMLSPERQAELTKEQDQVSKNITTLLNAFPETSDQVLADREKKTQANVELDLPTSSQDDSSEPTLSEADKEFAETGDYDVYSGGDTGATSSPTPAADYSYEGSDEQDEASNYDSTPSPASEPDQRDRGGDGSGGGGGGGKIVCTMMNENYGFGSFRNRIWQKYAKDNLTKEHEKGYHKIFLPLVKLSKTNIVIKKVLEHIAVHRTIDIRQEARGKVHILGRAYRKVLEPICYLVGKYVK